MMKVHPRLAGPAVGAAALLTATMVANPALSAPAAQGGAAPGVTGPSIAVPGHMGLDADDADIAIDTSGTAYVAWIGGALNQSDNRKIYLCVLPPDAGACKGGTQSIDSLGPSTANGIQVLTHGHTADVLWAYDGPDAGTSSHGGEVGEAVVQNDVLGAASPVETIPSHGSLLDAQFGPGGSLWTVAYAGVTVKQLEVREGVSNDPEIVKIPFPTADASLAFARGKPIIVVGKFGGITDPVAYTYEPGKSWTAPKTIPGTSGFATTVGLVATKSGVRLVTNAPDYHPVVAKWTGSGFSKPQGTGDKDNDYPSTHDDVTDASGRLVDVTNENGQIAVSNFPDTTHAVTFRFKIKGQAAGPEPQIATTPRGRGWVLWATEQSSAPMGDQLMIVPIRLGDGHVSKTAHGAHGSVTVVGPASCLPPTSLSVSVAGHPDSGWKIASKDLKLGSSSVGSSINGATLTAGKKYDLTGTVVFSNGGKHDKVKATLTFKACPAP